MWIFALLVVAGAVVAAVAEAVAAAVSEEKGLQVKAWARATPPGATSGAIYGTFSDLSGRQWTAVEISFPSASHGTVHESLDQDGMMKMQPAELRIDGQGMTELQPGGMHIMLMGLTAPLIEGCSYSFSIGWQDGSESSHRFITGSYGQSTMPVIEGRKCH